MRKIRDCLVERGIGDRYRSLRLCGVYLAFFFSGARACVLLSFGGSVLIELRKGEAVCGSSGCKWCRGVGFVGAVVIINSFWLVEFI